MKEIKWYHYLILCGIIAFVIGLLSGSISGIGLLSIAFGLLIMMGYGPRWVRSVSYAILWLHLIASFFVLFMSTNILLALLSVPYMVSAFAGVWLYKKEKEKRRAKELLRRGEI